MRTMNINLSDVGKLNRDKLGKRYFGLTELIFRISSWIRCRLQRTSTTVTASSSGWPSPWWRRRTPRKASSLLYSGPVHTVVF